MKKISSLNIEVEGGDVDNQQQAQQAHQQQQKYLRQHQQQ